MGLFKKSSFSTYDIIPPSNPNPNPKKYKILRYNSRNGNLVVELEYPDCTNYEGRKILVFKNTTLDELRNQGSIYPHFCNNPHMKSPFIRIVPTEEGWKIALKIAFEL